LREPSARKRGSRNYALFPEQQLHRGEGGFFILGYSHGAREERSYKPFYARRKEVKANKGEVTKAVRQKLQ
jgi:hypothetical protein